MFSSKKVNLWMRVRLVFYVSVFFIFIGIYISEGIRFSSFFIDEDISAYFLFNFIFLIIFTTELSLFISSKMQNFLENTKFTERIKPFSRFRMFVITIFSGTLILLVAFLIRESAISFILIPSIIMIFIGFFQIFKVWNFPTHKWYKSSLEKLFFVTLLIFNSGSIIIFTIEMLRFIYNTGVTGVLLLSLFLIFLMWGILSYFDHWAIRYEQDLTDKYITNSGVHQFSCAYCQAPLDDSMLYRINMQNYVYCANCGSKIMREEIFQPSRETVIQEHQEIMQKLNNIHNSKHLTS